jgi:hypothetical protein
MSSFDVRSATNATAPSAGAPRGQVARSARPSEGRWVERSPGVFARVRVTDPVAVSPMLRIR